MVYGVKGFVVLQCKFGDIILQNLYINGREKIFYEYIIQREKEKERDRDILFIFRSTKTR